MPDLILRDIDPDELRAAIVADVVNELRPMMERRSQTAQRIAGRAPMETAALLNGSIFAPHKVVSGSSVNLSAVCSPCVALCGIASLKR
uniref:hypothetical protein n=1 Tax=Rubripirellula obstinata TaxID=406547 RepID=UPI001EE4D27D